MVAHPAARLDVVLARRAGPAMGVGIGLHFYEFLNGLILPIMAVALAGADGATASGIWRWQLRVLSVTLGYNADVLLHWGAPFMRAFFAVKPEARPILIGAWSLAPRRSCRPLPGARQLF